VAAPLLASMATFYSFYPEHVFGIARQPMVLYLGAILIAGIVFLLTRLAGVFAGTQRSLSVEKAR